jgi:acyl carrier protein
VAADSFEERVLAIVASKIRILGDAPVTRSSGIADLGVESIDAVEIFFEIEDQLGVRVDTADFPISANTTVGDLIDFVRARQAEGAA